MKAISAVILVVIFFTAGVSYAEGLQTLIETGGNMAEISKALDDETASFQKVKKAVESGALQKGRPRDSVMAEYGKPVVMNTDTVTKRERWVYMPATSNFFKGIKIYLYFTTNGMLDEIVVKE